MSILAGANVIIKLNWKLNIEFTALGLFMYYCFHSRMDGEIGAMVLWGMRGIIAFAGWMFIEILKNKSRDSAIWIMLFIGSVTSIVGFKFLFKLSSIVFQHSLKF